MPATLSLFTLFAASLKPIKCFPVTILNLVQNPRWAGPTRVWAAYSKILLNKYLYISSVAAGGPLVNNKCFYFGFLKR